MRRGRRRGRTPPSRRASPLPQDGGHGTFTAGCVRVTAPEAAVHVVNALVPRQEGRADGAALGTAGIGAVFESDLAAPAPEAARRGRGR